MANVFGVEMTGLEVPGGGINFSGFGSQMMQGFLYIAIIGALSFIGYMFWSNSRYKFKIELFENLGGNGYVKSGTDRAKLIKLGDGGEMIIKLKKRKTLRTAYGRKMGDNLYWFAVGQDGYWYNVVLGDLDAKQGMLDIEPIDRDMRYMHVAIRKNIQDRYRQQNFMEKYGGWVIAGIFMLVLILGGWFIISKIGDATSTLAATQQVAAEVMKGNKDTLSALNNLLANSGIR